MARREAQAALDAARAESAEAHRAAEAHRKEFEETPPDAVVPTSESAAEKEKRLAAALEQIEVLRQQLRKVQFLLSSQPTNATSRALSANKCHF